MEKNLFANAEQTTTSKHIYASEHIVIDGRDYAVISVIPIKDTNRKIETAKDKIKYLISGGKK